MESHDTPARRPRVVIRKTPDGPVAVVNGTEVPISDYAVGNDEFGNPVLTLVLTPDSLQIGDPSTGAAAPGVRPAVGQVASWGDPSQPDPRESIPGWQPDGLSTQVAQHAERVALRGFEPSDGQASTSAFERLVRLSASAVTA